MGSSRNEGAGRLVAQALANGKEDVTAAPQETTSHILNSWKEIAEYLNRGVRTAQRWERELGMPVHRPRGHGRSAVIAIQSEIDHWLKSCPLNEPQEQKAPDTPLPRIAVVRIPNHELLLASQKLRDDVTHRRDQLSEVITTLITTVSKMGTKSPQAAEPELVNKAINTEITLQKQTT